MLSAKEHSLIDTLFGMANTAAVHLDRRGDMIDIRVEVNDLTEKIKDDYLALYCRSAGNQVDTNSLFIVIEADKYPVKPKR